MVCPAALYWEAGEENDANQLIPVPLANNYNKQGELNELCVIRYI